MDATQKEVMQTNYAYLVDHVNALDLHPKLVTKWLATQDLHERLITKVTRKEQVKELLHEIFRSPDPECFDKFIVALREVDGPHGTIADTLQRDHDNYKKTKKQSAAPISGRSRTEPPLSTDNAAGQPPLPSPSAPATTHGTGGADQQATPPSTVGQEGNFRPPPPPPPPKKAPPAEMCLARCPDGNIDDVKDVSFAILVANENEYLTVLNYFGMRYRIVSEKQLYTDDVLKCTFKSDPVITHVQNGDEAPEPNLTRLGKYYSICINRKMGVIYRSVGIGSGGRYGAMMTTVSLLKEAKDREWPLEIIFAVGCAGGRTKPGQDLTLGQVIVPKNVVDFNRGKIESGADRDKPPVYKREPEFWPTSESWFESLTNATIYHSTEEGYSISAASGVNDYCSDFVIKDSEVAEELRGLIADPKMIGIEMEGVGIATAIKIIRILDFYHRIKEVPEFLVVKGISDNADGSAKGTPAPMTFFEKEYKDVYPDDRQVMAALQSMTLVARAIHKCRKWKGRPAM